MITIYGLHTCPYCDFIQPQIAGRTDEFTYVDIGAHVRNMHKFIDLRDSRPEFDRLKKAGDIGIPCFVFDDGRISFDPADAGLVEYDPAKDAVPESTAATAASAADSAEAAASLADAEPACSIADHQAGRGC